MRVMMSGLVIFGTLLVGGIVALMTFAVSWGIAEKSTSAWVLLMGLCVICCGVSFGGALFLRKVPWLCASLCSLPTLVLNARPFYIGVLDGTFPSILLVPVVGVLMSSLLGYIMSFIRQRNDRHISTG